MENMIGLSSSRTVGSLAVRKDTRNRTRFGLYPLLFLTLFIASVVFFWPHNTVPSITDNSTFTQDDFSAPANTVAIDAADDATAPVIPAIPQAYDKDIKVQSGDTLSGLLLAQNISSPDVLSLLALPLVQHNLVHINPGQVFTIHVNAAQELTHLTCDISATQTLSITRQSDNKFEAILTKKPSRIMPTIASGVITTTFYDAGLAQNLPQKIILDAAHIFGSKVNFKRGLQPGDHFKVVYESNYVGSKAVSTGNILAMQISSGGKTYTLVRHTDNQGVSRYYAPDDKLGSRGAFLRAPVHYTRISSSFSLARKHPLLLFSRPHYGVDLAAPHGTPVVASSNGVIAVAGREGGYGNLVVINHGHGISTRYGHLSRFATNIHNGSYVKQGQIVGYVGSTGLASGPHLHYEVRINDIPKDPMTVKLSIADPVSASEQKRFNHEVQSYLAQMHRTPLTVLAYAPDLPQNQSNDEEA